MMVIMRYPAGHKDEVRARIVRVASRALRRHGLSGVSIPDLMKEAGMTHGGFYTHFKDRDDLLAAAVRAAADETATGVLANDHPLPESLGRYLSQAHLDHPESGCVLAALGTEAAKQPPRVRKAFAEIARGFVRLWERPRAAPKAATLEVSDEALVRAATIVGAVVLGRLLDERSLSERLLKAAHDAVTR